MDVITLLARVYWMAAQSEKQANEKPEYMAVRSAVIEGAKNAQKTHK